MSKRKNENTFDKEIQYVEDKSTQLKQIKQLEESKVKSSTLHDQDSNNKANNLINEQNKYALDQATLSQIDNQPSNDIAQKVILNIDHSKALEIFDKSDTETKQYYIDKTAQYVKNAPEHYPLLELMRGCAVEIYKFENNNIIRFLEGLYKSLQNENLGNEEINPYNLNADQLFSVAIYELIDIATF